LLLSVTSQQLAGQGAHLANVIDVDQRITVDAQETHLRPATGIPALSFKYPLTLPVVSATAGNNANTAMASS
jgi:hypothetical protein